MVARSTLPNFQTESENISRSSPLQQMHVSGFLSHNRLLKYQTLLLFCRTMNSNSIFCSSFVLSYKGLSCFQQKQQTLTYDPLLQETDICRAKKRFFSPIPLETHFNIENTRNIYQPSKKSTKTINYNENNTFNTLPQQPDPPFQ